MNQLPTFRYAHNAASFCTELASLLSADDIDALAAELARHGAQALPAWLTWQDEHQAEIERFAAASPGERQRRKAWAEPMHRARLIAAALLLLQNGRVLLSLLAQYGCNIGPDNTYRDAATQAGWLVSQLFHQLPDPYWPFDDAPSPFA